MGRSGVRGGEEKESGDLKRTKRWRLRIFTHVSNPSAYHFRNKQSSGFTRNAHTDKLHMVE